MQTFLPYPNFAKSFQVLDMKRLGKQRVEAMQIINILDGKQTTAGWRNHPAVKMWEGYTPALKQYFNNCTFQWITRGYKNNMLPYDIFDDYIEYPWWLGNEDFHRAMRARLIEKDEAYYLPLFPDDKGFNDGKYFWPVNETKTFKII